MDLSTIEKKLISDQYSTPEEFASDVRLIVSNCLTFNDDRPENETIRDVARKFNTLFERNYASEMDPNKQMTINQTLAHLTAMSNKKAPFWVSKCLKLLNELTKMDEQRLKLFLQPVNERRDRIFGYYSIIKNPMDFSTIRRRLNTQVYHDATDFAKDVHLVFENCLTFNPPDQLGLNDHIRNHAEDLRAYFDQHFPSTLIESAEENSARDNTMLKSSPVSINGYSQSVHRSNVSNLDDSDSVEHSQLGLDSIDGYNTGKMAASSGSIKAPKLNRSKTIWEKEALSLIRRLLEIKTLNAWGNQVFVCKPFEEMVDPVIDMAPDYYEVIEKPICFNKIKVKLNNLEYESIGEFVSDVLLIFENCMQYNAHWAGGVDLRMRASLIRRVFLEKMAKLNAKLQKAGQPTAELTRVFPQETSGDFSEDLNLIEMTTFTRLEEIFDDILMRLVKHTFAEKFRAPTPFVLNSSGPQVAQSAASVISDAVSVDTTHSSEAQPSLSKFGVQGSQNISTDYQEDRMTLAHVRERLEQRIYRDDKDEFEKDMNAVFLAFYEKGEGFDKSTVSVYHMSIHLHRYFQRLFKLFVGNQDAADGVCAEIEVGLQSKVVRERIDLSRVLRVLTSQKYREINFPFLEPVDHQVLQLHDYLSIVSQPMDLSTVRKKIDNDEYKTYGEFIGDLELIVNNAKLYNAKYAGIAGSYYELAVKFSKIITEEMHNVFVDVLDSIEQESTIQRIKDRVKWRQQELYLMHVKDEGKSRRLQEAEAQRLAEEKKQKEQEEAMLALLLDSQRKKREEEEKLRQQALEDSKKREEEHARLIREAAITSCHAVRNRVRQRVGKRNRSSLLTSAHPVEIDFTQNEEITQADRGDVEMSNEHNIASKDELEHTDLPPKSSPFRETSWNILSSFWFTKRRRVFAPNSHIASIFAQDELELYEQDAVERKEDRVDERNMHSDCTMCLTPRIPQSEMSTTQTMHQSSKVDSCVLCFIPRGLFKRGRNSDRISHSDDLPRLMVISVSLGQSHHHDATQNLHKPNSDTQSSDCLSLLQNSTHIPCVHVQERVIPPSPGFDCKLNPACQLWSVPFPLSHWILTFKLPVGFSSSQTILDPDNRVNTESHRIGCNIASIIRLHSPLSKRELNKLSSLSEMVCFATKVMEQYGNDDSLLLNHPYPAHIQHIVRNYGFISSYKQTGDRISSEWPFINQWEWDSLGLWVSEPTRVFYHGISCIVVQVLGIHGSLDITTAPLTLYPEFTLQRSENPQITNQQELNDSQESCDVQQQKSPIEKENADLDAAKLLIDTVGVVTATLQAQTNDQENMVDSSVIPNDLSWAVQGMLDLFQSDSTEL